MKSFRVKIQGTTPLLHHRMNEEVIMGLLKAKKPTKKQAKEEKTPREIAQGHVYQKENGECYIPSTFISGAFLKASSDFKRSDSSRKSLKSVAGGAFRILSENLDLKKDGIVIRDFEVDIKKATNHRTGAVVVCRPRFDKWEVEFDLSIDEELIDQETAKHILDESGRRVGIGSFRVSNGGYFGQFQVVEWIDLK